MNPSNSESSLDLNVTNTFTFSDQSILDLSNDGGYLSFGNVKIKMDGSETRDLKIGVLMSNLREKQSQIDQLTAANQELKAEVTTLKSRLKSLKFTDDLTPRDWEKKIRSYFLSRDYINLYDAFQKAPLSHEIIDLFEDTLDNREIMDEVEWGRFDDLYNARVLSKRSLQSKPDDDPSVFKLSTNDLSPQDWENKIRFYFTSKDYISLYEAFKKAPMTRGVVYLLEETLDDDENKLSELEWRQFNDLYDKRVRYNPDTPQSESDTVYSITSHGIQKLTTSTK